MEQTLKFGNSEYTLNEIADKEFYEVESEKGSKYVHVSGYVWRYEDGTWRYSYYSFCYIKYTGFAIEQEDVDNALCEVKMYEEENLTAEHVANLAQHYFEDEPITPLPIEEVTDETPDGCYINIQPK